MNSVKNLFFLMYVGIQMPLFGNYLYPVATIKTEHNEQLLLFHQKSLECCELLQWNPETKEIDKLLSSQYIPAGLQMLPDCSGFSFIDNGRIKIKSFNKRSPKSLDIYEPLYNIQILNWIDPKQCYFSAFEGSCAGIYHMTINGQIYKLLGDDPGQESNDYMYPQKVGTQLFYIKRSIRNGYKTNGITYSVEQADYPKVPVNGHFNDNTNYDERVKKLMESSFNGESKALIQTNTLICDFDTTPIAFLYMCDTNHGFVLEHEKAIDKNDETMSFNYHCIKKTGRNWCTTELFSFQLPTSFFIGDETRLYESILPLLPKYYDDVIYYMDCSHVPMKNIVNLYAYSLEQKTSKQLTHGQNSGKNTKQHYFAPYFCNGTLFYGGSSSWANDFYGFKG